jgi:hypothetical protein
VTTLAANPQRRTAVFEVGRERSPLLCIDDFAANPETLVARAVDADFIDAGPVYPGVRAPAPRDYLDVLVAAISADVTRAFGAPPRDEFELCAFSMVTTPAEALRPVQRIPHFDGPESGRIAFLHYLCDASQGGTSFFRHAATGFEAITPARLDAYRDAIGEELGPRVVGAGYAHAGMRGFERIHRVEAAFNRLVVYKGNALHSGDIGARTVLSEEPRAGRLTVNGFGFLDS